jgi:hypothetical protein
MHDPVSELRRTLSAKGQDSQAWKVNSEHRALVDCVRDSLAHARRAGTSLVKARARRSDDEWVAWVREHCHFSVTTAEAYIRIAKDWNKLSPKAQAVADLLIDVALRLLPPAAEEAGGVAPGGEDHTPARAGAREEAGDPVADVADAAPPAAADVDPGAATGADGATPGDRASPTAAAPPTKAPRQRRHQPAQRELAQQEVPAPAEASPRPEQGELTLTLSACRTEVPRALAEGIVKHWGRGEAQAVLEEALAILAEQVGRAPAP